MGLRRPCPPPAPGVFHSLSSVRASLYLRPPSCTTPPSPPRFPMGLSVGLQHLPAGRYNPGNRDASRCLPVRPAAHERPLAALAQHLAAQHVLCAAAAATN
eukprot:6166550-Pleurochrysis_carterae.AAC.1